MLEHVIFAIDNGDDAHVTAKFLRRMDTLKAMGVLTTPVVQTIGCYKGQLENSYMMMAKDMHHVRDYVNWIEGQESILRVPGDVRQPCELEFSDGSVVSVGPMREASAVEALQAEAWTYVPTTGKYFVCG